jgi:hypothetical protein
MLLHGDKIHIPLPEDEALRGLFKVKPTKDMPRARGESDREEKGGKEVRQEGWAVPRH